MRDNQIDLGLRDRLIIAGLTELEEHGIKDFSLRRVALRAEVSCAAPYRHFKDKDELIIAIINYVKEGWDLLSAQIQSAFTDDTALAVRELCASFVRFWIANGNFRSVLMLVQHEVSPEITKLLKDFDSPIINATTRHIENNRLSQKESEQLTYAVLSLLYGTLMLINKGTLSSETAIEILKNRLIGIL